MNQFVDRCSERDPVCYLKTCLKKGADPFRETIHCLLGAANQSLKGADPFFKQVRSASSNDVSGNNLIRLRRSEPSPGRTDDTKAAELDTLVGQTLGLQSRVAWRKVSVAVDDTPPRKLVCRIRQHSTGRPRRTGRPARAAISPKLMTSPSCKLSTASAIRSWSGVACGGVDRECFMFDPALVTVPRSKMLSRSPVRKAQQRLVREMSVGVLSELASTSWDRSGLGEHADKKSDSNFPHDAKLARAPSRGATRSSVRCGA